MQPFGLNTVVFLSYLLNVALLVAWLTLAIVALLRLRHRRLPEVARVLWAMLVVLVPVLGALAFFLVRPGVDDTLSS